MARQWLRYDAPRDVARQKLLRYDCYPPATFAHMARVYRALTSLHGGGAAAPPTAVVLDTRLLFGEHEVMVDMAAVSGTECADADIECDAVVREAVADAVAWLATQRILYTDLRGPNVLRTEDGARLVDYETASG